MHMKRAATPEITRKVAENRACGIRPLECVASRGPTTAAKTELKIVIEIARVRCSAGTTWAAAYFANPLNPLSAPTSAVPRQSSGNDDASSATAHVMPPQIPSVPPAMKPSRRPTLPIRKEAGAEASAAPSWRELAGRVEMVASPVMESAASDSDETQVRKTTFSMDVARISSENVRTQPPP